MFVYLAVTYAEGLGKCLVSAGGLAQAEVGPGSSIAVVLDETSLSVVMLPDLVEVDH